MFNLSECIRTRVRTVYTEFFSVDRGGYDLATGAHTERVASSFLFFSTFVCEDFMC